MSTKKSLNSATQFHCLKISSDIFLDPSTTYRIIRMVLTLWQGMIPIPVKFGPKAPTPDRKDDDDDDDDDEIAYFTVRWKTRGSFVYHAPKT